ESRLQDGPLLQSEIQPSGSKFEIIPPFGFGIEIKRPRGQQISGRRRVRQIEDVLRREQALIGIRGIAGCKQLVTNSKRVGQTSRDVWADRRPCPSRGILKY